MRDGVRRALALPCYQKNPIAGSTEALLFFRRNVDVIGEILRKATPATNEVLVKRINDRTTPDSIRLIYAGMLAWLGDARGRAFLLERTDPDGALSVDALYCLGRFLAAAPPGADLRWAEERLVALMTSRKEIVLKPSIMGNTGRFTVADGRRCTMTSRESC